MGTLHPRQRYQRAPSDCSTTPPLAIIWASKPPKKVSLTQVPPHGIQLGRAPVQLRRPPPILRGGPLVLARAPHMLIWSSRLTLYTLGVFKAVRVFEKRTNPAGARRSAPAPHNCSSKSHNCSSIRYIMRIKGEVPECVHRLVTVPGCCVYTCTPRATTTHNSTSHFAVERFLGLYHDAPRR